MNNLKRNVLAACVLWIATGGAAYADFSGVVVAVLDGDTLDVLVDKKPVRVRLANIDAPETKQAFGTRSRQTLRAATFQKNVTVLSSSVDRYGRAIGTVLVDGQDINKSMVAQGMALVYRKYLSDRGYLAIEASAKAARLGLWADPEPIPPWEWRKLSNEDRRSSAARAGVLQEGASP